MSDERPPEGPEVVRDFLARHRHTGEPTDAAVERVHRRLLARVQPTRRWSLPGEVWAAAAVLAVVVALQGLMGLVGGPGSADAGVAPPDERVARLEGLVRQGSDLSQAGNWDGARTVFEECVRLEPGYAPCVKHLASVFAKIAGRDSSQVAIDQSFTWFKRYVELAPSAPDAPQCQKIVDTWKECGNCAETFVP